MPVAAASTPISAAMPSAAVYSTANPAVPVNARIQAARRKISRVSAMLPRPAASATKRDTAMGNPADAKVRINKYNGYTAL
ncbi:hypothetical protein D3C75_1016790 [compost metagenome]